MTDEAAAPEGEKKGMAGWLIALLALSGLLVICLGASFFGAVATLVPRIQMKQRQTTCANHLRTLGGLYVSDVMTRGEEPGEGGAHYFLRLVNDASADPSLLSCPADPVATTSKIVAVGDGEQSPADAAVLRRACSYAVRDFARYPVDDVSTDAFIAADADEFHRHGINVLMSNGSVQFKDREALGLAPDEPIIVGPESPHPELAKLCIVPAR